MGARKLNPNDYINKTFDRLTGVEFLGVENGDSMMRWRCECGNIIDLPITRVKNGYVRSCGCLAKELAAKRLKKTNEYDLSGDYGVGRTSSGYEFYFDLEDYKKIKDFCWHKHKDGYLRTYYEHFYDEQGKRHHKYIMLHQLIGKYYNIGDGFEIDHINGKPYDNRKVNLRESSHSLNMQNVRLPASNTSGHKGVHYSKRENKWKAGITCNTEKIHLGTFLSYEDAVKAREKAERKYFGEFNRNKEDLLNGTRCYR